MLLQISMGCFPGRADNPAYSSVLGKCWPSKPSYCTPAAISAFPQCSVLNTLCLRKPLGKESVALPGYLGDDIPAKHLGVQFITSLACPGLTCPSLPGPRLASCYLMAQLWLRGLIILSWGTSGHCVWWGVKKREVAISNSQKQQLRMSSKLDPAIWFSLHNKQVTPASFCSEQNCQSDFPHARKGNRARKKKNRLSSWHLGPKPSGVLKPLDHSTQKCRETDSIY